MAYLTAVEIERRLGALAYVQLTDDAGSGVADLNRVEEARASAEGEFDSYAAARFAVPLDLTGRPELAGVVKGVVLDLVAYRLHLRRPPVPPDVARRYQQVVSWLRRLAAGQAHLPSLSAMEPNGTRGEVARTTGPRREFSRETLRDS